MPDVLAFLGSIGFAVPTDALVFGGLALAAVVYGFTLGRDRSIVPLLSLYVAYVLTLHLPLVPRLNHWLTLPPSPNLPIFWFVAFLALGIFLFRRTPHIQGLSRDSGTWWEAILFGALQVGLAVCFVTYLLPASTIANWSPHLQAVFVQEWGRTFWMLSPLLFLVFLRRSYGFPSELTLS